MSLRPRTDLRIQTSKQSTVPPLKENKAQVAQSSSSLESAVVPSRSSESSAV